MHPSCRRLTILIITALTILTLAAPVRAQEETEGEQDTTGVQVISPDHTYTFGEEVRFTARIASSLPVQEVAVLVKVEGQADTTLLPAEIDEEGEVVAHFDLSRRPLRAFAVVSYQFIVTFENGFVHTSLPESFSYEDNRFPWRMLQNGPFILHWYAGDLAFAQEALDVAQAGLDRAQGLLPLDPPEQINIYVYNSALEMQAALLLSGQHWVAGHAHPGLILVSLPPGLEQHLEMERQIPHELMHVLLFQEFGPAYSKLPVWLNEGLASLAELYPNPDYHVLLDGAYQKGSLLPLASLCQNFPKDSAAHLAYAQSASFTRYLYNQYGTPGLQELLAQYAAGLDCERGPERALGSGLSRLENQWRRDTFAENLWQSALEDLLPWLVIMLAILAAPLISTVVKMRKRPFR